MGLKKLFLITVLAGAMSVLGCGDDETGNGGAGATGGDGGTGGTAATGGSGGTGGDPFDSELCNREACAGNDTLRQACETALEACRLVPDLQQDECIGIALAACNL
jgi:hypothetical protein